MGLDGDDNSGAPSVQICIGYVDNMMTLYHLRHSSGCPVDSTIYTLLTGRLDSIKLISNMCPLIRTPNTVIRCT